MKIKSFSPSKKFDQLKQKIPKKRSSRLLIVLLVVVAIALLAILSQKDSKRVDCDSLTKQSDNLYVLDNSSAKNSRNELAKIQKEAADCKTGETSNIDLLKFNTQMAISSYRFGDYEQAKVYADKALKLNTKVDDGVRDEFFKSAEVNEQMEAIKNGNY